MSDNNIPTAPSWAPGWYPDTNVPGSERYYDGAGWTEQVRPVTGVPTALANGTVRKSHTNILGIVSLVLSAIGFIFACVPGALIVGWILLPAGFILGIVSLFLAGRQKWQGITAIVLSVVGTIVGIIVFASLAVGAVDDAISDGVTAEVESSDNAEESATEDEPDKPVADEPTVADPVELVLGETAFGMDDNGWGWYAVEVTNPNEDYVFGMSGLDIEAYDADGVLLDTDVSYGTILQGKSMYVGRFLNINSAVIDRIEVRGPSADAATHSPADETGSFTVGDIKTTSEYGWLTVTGTITSEFSEDQESVRIDLVARDAAGEIVGVEFTYTDRVPAGGTAAWDASYWEIPLDATIEAYPHL